MSTSLYSSLLLTCIGLCTVIPTASYLASAAHQATSLQQPYFAISPFFKATRSLLAPTNEAEQAPLSVHQCFWQAEKCIMDQLFTATHSFPKPATPVEKIFTSISYKEYQCRQQRSSCSGSSCEWVETGSATVCSLSERAFQQALVAILFCSDAKFLQLLSCSQARDNGPTLCQQTSGCTYNPTDRSCLPSGMSSNEAAEFFRELTRGSLNNTWFGNCPSATLTKQLLTTCMSNKQPSTCSQTRNCSWNADSKECEPTFAYSYEALKQFLTANGAAFTQSLLQSTTQCEAVSQEQACKSTPVAVVDTKKLEFFKDIQTYEDAVKAPQYEAAAGRNRKRFPAWAAATIAVAVLVLLAAPPIAWYFWKRSRKRTAFQLLKEKEHKVILRTFNNGNTYAHNPMWNSREL